ncbi:MAG: divalent metal cation transporter, partial [Cyclobacteriaceae bacterium]|nr:divalent metal cation transporter [Cyclobacteriaceae bacterium]
EPLFGSASYIVFMIGLFAASFSSLIGNATLGGVILSDTLSLGRKLSGWPARLLIILLIISGSLVAIVFSDLRLQLIVFAQGFTILIVPVIGFFIFHITNSKKIMGTYKNSIFTKIIGIMGLMLLVTLAFGYGYLFFFN